MNLANFSSSAGHNSVYRVSITYGSIILMLSRSSVVLSVLISGKLSEVHVNTLQHMYTFQLSASIFIAITVLSFRIVGLPSWLLIKLVCYNCSTLVASRKIG